MSLDFTDDRSTLVQVMAWCRQAASHYLNQCWPRSKPPYGITRPQWVNAQHEVTAYVDPYEEEPTIHSFYRDCLNQLGDLFMNKYHWSIFVKKTSNHPITSCKKQTIRIQILQRIWQSTKPEALRRGQWWCDEWNKHSEYGLCELNNVLS